MSTATSSRRHRFKHYQFAKEANQAIEQLTSLQKNRFKSASIGGDQESQFEQAFASLAFAYMKDKAPRLLDFMIGFQLVDRNDDNTKAVGVFGFKVGDQWVYAPVFFLNGDLKGHELLYIKAQDQFVPLKEDWVNYLLNRKPHILGEGTPYNLQQLGVMRPQLSSMSGPPTKRGSAEFELPEKLAEWCREFLPFLGTAELTPTKLFNKFAGLNDRLDMRKFLTQDLRLIQMAMKTAADYPLIKQAFDQFYGEDFFVECLRELRAKIVKQSSILNPARIVPQSMPPSRRCTILGVVEPDSPRSKVAVQLKVDEDQAITQNIPDMTDEERKRLYDDQIVIRDERSDDEKSIAYNTQIEMKLTNPSESGIYEMLTAEGEFERILVVSSPYSNEGQHDFLTVVRLEGENRNWVNAYRTQLWVRDVEDRAEYRKWQHDGAGKDGLEVGATYVAITPTGHGTVPFEVNTKLDDGSYDVWYSRYASGPRPITSRPRFDYPRAVGSTLGWDDGRTRVYINHHKGSKLKSVQGALYIPDDSRFVKVREPEEWRKAHSAILGGCGCSSPEKDKKPRPSPVVPGDLSSLALSMSQKTARLKVVSNRTEYFINNDQPRTKLATIVALVCGHGLSEKSARIIVDKAYNSGKAIYRVKYANPYGPAMPSSDYAPPFPEPDYDFETYPNGNGVQTMEPQNEHVPVDGLDAGSTTDPEAYDPWNYEQPDPGALQTAQQAGQSGQKEVFDTHMIGGMLKAVREDSLVDRYLGDLLKALDRLGRVLFMFYWHNDEFSDRYGKQDMPELEDSLRNTFESLGDVTLFLKQKTVEPYSSQSIGEPSIEHSARN